MVKETRRRSNNARGPRRDKKVEVAKKTVTNEDGVDVFVPVEIESTEITKEAMEASRIRDAWKPKTDIGRRVKAGEINDLNEVLEKGEVISEPEVIDVLFPNLKSELLLVGQAKGKFGGGQRRIFRQTQKKTKDGNTISFVSICACGNGDGYVGLGFGKSKETVPAKEKAIRSAKLNMIKIRRGCGSWVCNCGGFHSIPYTVIGRSGGVTIKIMPAPKGKGLVINSECRKILELAGIKDVWTKIKGPSKCRLNVVKACLDALDKLSKTKVPANFVEKSVDGQLSG